MRRIGMVSGLVVLLICGAHQAFAEETAQVSLASTQEVKTPERTLVPLLADAVAGEKKAKTAKPIEAKPKVSATATRLELPACLSLQWCGCCLFAPFSFLGF